MHVILEGDLDGDAVSISLRHVDLPQFPLMNRGLHRGLRSVDKGFRADVPVDAPPIFASLFDSMKQEFVSARWLLYEGLTMKVTFRHRCAFSGV